MMATNLRDGASPAAPHLFAPEPLFIGFNRKRYLSKHLIDLIRMLAPLAQRR